MYQRTLDKLKNKFKEKIWCFWFDYSTYINKISGVEWKEDKYLMATCHLFLHIRILPLLSLLPPLSNKKRRKLWWGTAWRNSSRSECTATWSISTERATASHSVSPHSSTVSRKRPLTAMWDHPRQWQIASSTESWVRLGKVSKKGWSRGTIVSLIRPIADSSNREAPIAILWAIFKNHFCLTTIATKATDQLWVTRIRCLIIMTLKKVMIIRWKSIKILVLSVHWIRISNCLIPGISKRNWVRFQVTIVYHKNSIKWSQIVQNRQLSLVPQAEFNGKNTP